MSDDAELRAAFAVFADDEQRMILMHDQKVLYGVSAEEVARHRPKAVADAAAIAQTRREELIARRRPRS